MNRTIATIRHAAGDLRWIVHNGIAHPLLAVAAVVQTVGQVIGAIAGVLHRITEPPPETVEPIGTVTTTLDDRGMSWTGSVDPWVGR